MKLKEFDRPTCRLMREAIQTALAPVGEQFGVKIELSSGSFMPSNYNVKVTACVAAADGNAMTPDAERFKCYAPLYGFKPEDLFAEFKWNGDRWQVVGMTRTLGKYPILCKKVGTGKVFKLPMDSVLAGLGRRDAARVGALVSH